MEKEVIKGNIHHKKSGIIFAWQDEVQSYEPIYHNVRYNEYGEMEADEIQKGDIFYDFIAFIRHSSMETDKRTGKKKYGLFEIYQWAIAFNLIKQCMKLDSSKAITAISRQAGKSYSARKIIAFLIIFLPSHIYVPEDRYYAIMCSPKESLIKDHMNKIEPDVKKAIELFNMMHPTSRIISPDEDKNLLNQLINKEYDRIINGEQVHYSQIIGLSLNKTVTNAGYSAHLLFLDEAQEIDNASFKQQVQPFVTRTGGITYALGTTLPDDSNVLYNMYKDKSIPDESKIMYTWEDVYKSKKCVNEKGADKYKNSVTKEIEAYGIRSEYVQTQYYCSFNVRGERFITIDDLEHNNILSGVMEDNLREYGGNQHIYKIAAFDPATTIDFAFLTAGLALKYPGSERFKIALKDCRILNKNDEKVSSDRLLDMVVEYCAWNEIDMIMIDATAAQEDRAFHLWKKLKLRGVNTLVIPYSYAGMNKQHMMASFEDAIYNQTLIMPRKEYIEVHEDYRELFEETLYLQRNITDRGTVTYKAPEGDRFHDDGIMSLSMLNYMCYYIQKMSKKNHIIDLGDGVRYKLKFNRNRADKGPVKEKIRISNYVN